MRETLRSLVANRKSTPRAFPSPTTTTHRRNRKDRRQAYSLLLQTTMEPLSHGLWSCSSKPLTGRTGQVEGRFNYWNHWRYTLDIQESLPLPDKDSSHDDDDMPCWLHSIEATTPATSPAGTTRQALATFQETDSFASRTP